MTLPNSRNRDYSFGDPVEEVDLNDIQDCIISGAHGDRIIAVGAWMAPALAGAHVAGEPSYWNSTASVHAHRVPLPLKAGDRLKSITWHYHNAANPGSAKTFSVRKQVGPTDSLVTGWSTTATGTALADNTLVQAPNQYVVVSGELIFLKFITANISDRLYTAIVTYDRPIS